MTEAKNTNLPPGLEAELQKTPENKDDQIKYLKSELATTEDAKKDIEKRYNELLAENKVLNENYPIKKSAIRYAKVFLILIPLLSLALLIWSALGYFNFGLEKYSESALVIGPIAFVATLLSVMIRSVFNQKSSSDENILKSEILKLIDK